MSTACYRFPDIAETQSVDPKQKYEALYRALIFVLRDRFRLDKDGNLFPSTIADLKKIPYTADTAEERATHDKLKLVVSTIGLLFQENQRDPLLGKARLRQGETAPDILRGDLGDGEGEVQVARRWVEQVASAVSEYEGGSEMFDKVFDTLAQGGANHTVYAHQVAEVSRRLIEERRDPHHPQIKTRINNVLAVILGDGVQGRASAIDVNLPSLDEGTTADIIPDNVKALAVVYFAAQLEELKFFATADKVVEHFTTGMLPLTRGPGGQAVYEHMKSAIHRLTEVERRSLYARSFGFAQGSIDEPLPNREFQDSWIRLLSGVSQYARLYGSTGGTAQSRVVLQGPNIQVEQVFKSAKDLAVNLSLHGYGIAHFAAVELQQLVRDVKAMLSYDDVLKAYGVLDVWQLVERVSQLYLGGSVNGVAKRTMATAGANIIQWLAKNATLLGGSNSSALAALLLDTKSHDPIDQIASNVERWLAVTGTGDDSVEKYAEPVAMPTQATIPNLSLQAAAPEALRGVLSQVGNGVPGFTMPGGAIPRA